jgi:hypothetical protein
MSEEQFLAYLDSVASSADAARVRQLVMKKLGGVPDLQINFVTPQDEVLAVPQAEDRAEVIV